MKYYMQKTANNFRKRKLKNNVNFKTVTAYLQSVGFSVVFYDKNTDNELLIKYNLTEFSKTVKGFTVYRKDFRAVFIEENSSCEEKLYVLLHETAHIILKHIDNKNIKDSRLIEMEADAFAYQVLSPYGNSSLLKALLVFMCVFCIVSNQYWINASYNVSAISQTVPSQASTEEANTTLVYVTPSGTKYHRPDCRYVKGKNCDSLSVAEAYRKYTPCSVCRP